MCGVCRLLAPLETTVPVKALPSALSTRSRRSFTNSLGIGPVENTPHTARNVHPCWWHKSCALLQHCDKLRELTSERVLFDIEHM